MPGVDGTTNESLYRAESISLKIDGFSTRISYQSQHYHARYLTHLIAGSDRCICCNVLSVCVRK